MICETIPLWENGSNAVMETYLPEQNSFNQAWQSPAVLIAPGGAYGHRGP